MEGYNMIEALRKKYEADIAHAKANIEVYLHNPVGIGEHPDLVSAVDEQIDNMAHAEDKLEVLNKIPLGRIAEVGDASDTMLKEMERMKINMPKILSDTVYICENQNEEITEINEVEGEVEQIVPVAGVAGQL